MSTVFDVFFSEERELAPILDAFKGSHESDVVGDKEFKKYPTGFCHQVFLTNRPDLAFNVVFMSVVHVHFSLRFLFSFGDHGRT